MSVVVTGFGCRPITAIDMRTTGPAHDHRRQPGATTSPLRLRWRRFPSPARPTARHPGLDEMPDSHRWPPGASRAALLRCSDRRATLGGARQRAAHRDGDLCTNLQQAKADRGAGCRAARGPARRLVLPLGDGQLGHNRGLSLVAQCQLLGSTDASQPTSMLDPLQAEVFSHMIAGSVGVIRSRPSKV